MSGDVQPRKRKDKKRKKDELGVEEPRGTAAALGEGDVFIHSHHDHGTGGHWCAKIIFFSLLAVLISLIGLIILENRGLSELEANSVESRYSGVLEGWLEDAPDDDHHDEHTLELKHHDDEDDHSPEIDDEHGEIDDHDEEGDDHDADDDDHDEEGDDHDEDDDDQDAEDDDHDEEDDEHDEDDDEHDEDNKGEIDDQYEEDDNKSDENEIDNQNDDDNDIDDHNDDDDDIDDHNDDEDEFDDQNDDEDRNYAQDEADEQANDDELNNDESNEEGKDEDNETAEDEKDDFLESDENDVADADDKQDDDQSVENDHDEDISDENDLEGHETQENEEDDSHEKEEEEDLEVEVERLENEISDDDALSEELPAAEAEEDDKSEEFSRETGSKADVEDEIDNDDDVSEDEDFLEPDDIEEELPVVEHIVVPKGKPLVEVEDEPSTVKPADTLADEEEYEKQQEELKREQEQASHMWLKLLVGSALLVATHAVVRRATAPRDETPASDEHDVREETPVINRRMTLIIGETATAVQSTQPMVEEPILEMVTSTSQSTHLPTEESDEEEEEDDEVVIETKDTTTAKPSKQIETDDKELFSDEEEAEDEEEEEEIIKEPVKKIPQQTASQKVLKPEPEPEVEEDVPDDVEIIDDEQIEEELEEEENEEEEISDVDDAELLSRLEAKYGRLPEPDRPGQKQKDGGNSIEDDWPGEPNDQYWRQQLDQAEEELRQGDWKAASERAAAEQLKGSARARWVLARAIDASAEARRDNRLLTRAIAAYLDVLKMNDRLTDNRLIEVAQRTLDRMRFRGNYLGAEPVYRLLIRRFPDVPDFHNNLTVSFLMANRADLAEQVIKDTLQKWPDDRIALAHHGFVLKTQHNRLEEAVEAFQKALDGDTGPATESRFYYHLGDSLLLLGRYAEAHEVHKRGAAMGHFLSPAQRSLYNVERLKSQPWWDIEQTPYLKLARALEKSWKEILKEGEAAKASYEKEKEGLKERGEWSQLDLFVRGQEIPNRCKRAPVTCSIVRSEAAAAGCRRGQVKFSAMEAGTHVRPHVGPTNCRLRMHLGLSNTKDTYIRVDQETRQWKVGKTFMFDDSFEHEVWHNGTGTRLVLIVDVWHPALTTAERRTLPPI